MRKLILFTAALLCSVSMWAESPSTEGPWTFLQQVNGFTAKNYIDYAKFSYVEGWNDKWSGTITGWKDGDGTGFTFSGNSDPKDSKMAIFSLFSAQASVPAYTAMKLNWTFQIGSKSTKHHSTTCLYGLQGTVSQIKNIEVDFSDDYETTRGSDYLLAPAHKNDKQDGNKRFTGNQTFEFDFNNHDGSVAKDITWYLMMTHVMGCGDTKSGLYEWGCFKHISADTTWTYGLIISFNANGGTGTMDPQTIDDYYNLSANTFVKDGYIFAGWATTPDGPVVYTDGAVITATAGFKGPQTLYAQWTEWGHGTKEGPWTQLERKSLSCGNGDNLSIAYNQLNNTQWTGTITNVSGETGIGYAYDGSSADNSKMGIFSIYRYQVAVPAYASLNLKWTYNLYSKTTGHHSTACLYGHQNYDQLKALAVDFTNHYTDASGSANLLARLTRYDQQGEGQYTPVRNAGMLTHTFAFDNYAGSTEQTKTWYLMLTHVMESASGKTGLDEWAMFKSLFVDTVWTYRAIITFNANGGAGTMNAQTIDQKGQLSPNAFTRDGYSFIGWATSANGPVVYADGEKITVTEDRKGPVTLYAQWAEGDYDPATLTALLTYVGRRTGTSVSRINPSATYLGLNGNNWSNPTTVNEGDSTGYKYTGKSPNLSKNATFSIYKIEKLVPACSSIQLTWTFRLGVKNTKHPSTVCLYALPESLDQIQNLAVDFSDDYQSTTGSDFLIAAPLSQMTPDGKTRFTDQAYTFTFDNRASSVAQTKTWYIMFTYVISSIEGVSNLDERGYFKSLRVKTTSLYRKVFSFHANGGVGTMDEQTIETSGNLNTAAYTREGYTFVGWATTPDGEKVYDDEAAITATAEDNGAISLYAVWTLNEYAISYELNGGSVSSANPTNYTVETTAFTLNNPTKDNCAFLGWTGSNSNVPQTDVSISKGTTGTKSYTANWARDEITTVITLIAAIDEVVYNPECKALLNLVRGRYEGLSADEKALVSNYTTLTAAEAAYEALEDAAGNTTIRFVEMDGTTIVGDDKTIQLVYPEAPTIQGYTFDHWLVVSEDVTSKTIRLQAVYTKD